MPMLEDGRIQVAALSRSKWFKSEKSSSLVSMLLLDAAGSGSPGWGLGMPGLGLGLRTSGAEARLRFRILKCFSLAYTHKNLLQAHVEANMNSIPVQHAAPASWRQSFQEDLESLRAA